MVVFNNGCVGGSSQRVPHWMVLVGLVQFSVALGAALATDKIVIVGCFGGLLVSFRGKNRCGILAQQEPDRQSRQQEDATDQGEDGTGETSISVMWSRFHNLAEIASRKDIFSTAAVPTVSGH